MANDSSWTGEFAKKRLQKHSNVKSVVALAPQILKVTRNNATSFVVATVAALRVDEQTIRAVLERSRDVEFVANIPKESYWAGDAIALCKSSSAAFGSLGDLLSAVATDDVRRYVNKEYGFVERGLRQHSCVDSLDRLSDRHYFIKRKFRRPPISMVFLNEYELTADHVRTARDRYGEFGVLLMTNPSGNPTAAASQAAESMGIEVHKWGALLRRLNK